MKNLVPVFTLLLSPLAASAETPGLPAFHFTGAAELRADQAAVAAPEPRPADVIVKGHLFIQAGADSLFGYADTPEQFVEAAAHWTEVLKAAGIEPGAPTYQGKIFILPYRTTDGRMLRAFLADARQFPPKDDAGLRANMAAAQRALSAAGLTPVAARVVNLDFLLPTYSILYLTKPEAVREHERQLRVLKPGNVIDADLLQASGVRVVQKPEPWLLVYIGPELGYVSLAAKTREDLARRLERSKAYLIGKGKQIIGEKLIAVDDAEYKFGAELLFFQ